MSVESLKEPSGKSHWDTILKKLKERLASSAYTTWFTNSVELDFGNGKLIVQVQGADYYVDYINKQYGDMLKEIMEEIGLDGIQLILVPMAREDTEDSEEKKEKKGSPQKSPNRIYGDLQRKYTFDNFIVGKSNQIAYTACRLAATSPGQQYNPLFIYGGVGLGKTHLLHAIGNFLYLKKGALKIVYSPTENIMNSFFEALQKKKMHTFKASLREADILLMDDIQFLKGKELLQEEIFHTFNHLHDKGKQIVMTSDRHPADIQFLQERLVSRFKWGLVVQIAPPDYETRIAILKNKAASAGLILQEEAFSLIAQIIKNSIRDLEGAINKLHAFYSITKTDLTMSIVEEMLFEESNKKRLDIDILTDIVAREFGITKKQLKSKSRKKDFLLPRQVAMYLAREYLGLNLMSIGEFFGGKDHTTVMNAIRKIQKGLLDEAFQKKLGYIREKLESAI